MGLSDKIEVREGGIHGRSWFAIDDIAAGELLWWQVDAPEYEHIVTEEELATWPQAQRDEYLALAYEIRKGVFNGFPPGVEVPLDIIRENYVNHCCDGNAWYDGDHRLIAMRDIRKGEEINYDYALTESSSSFEIVQCLCGKAKCRGRITGNDWQLPELQERYGDHFLPYINDLIRASKQQQSTQ